MSNICATLKVGALMPTLFAVYNLRDKFKAEEYDRYLTNTKIHGISGAQWCTALTLGK